MTYLIYQCETCNKFYLQSSCSACPNKKLKLLKNEPILLKNIPGVGFTITRLKDL